MTFMPDILKITENKVQNFVLSGDKKLVDPVELYFEIQGIEKTEENATFTRK